MEQGFSCMLQLVGRTIGPAQHVAFYLIASYRQLLHVSECAWRETVFLPMTTSVLLGFFSSPHNSIMHELRSHAYSTDRCKKGLRPTAGRLRFSFPKADARGRRQNAAQTGKASVIVSVSCLSARIPKNPLDASCSSPETRNRASIRIFRKPASRSQLLAAFYILFHQAFIQKPPSTRMKS